MTCQSCGFENQENQKFCGQCGAGLETAVSPTAAAPKKKSRLGLFALVGIVFLCGLIFFWPTGGSEPAASVPRPTSAPTTVDVTYRVTGRAVRGSATLENATGNTEQKNISSSAGSFDAKPWVMAFTAERGQFVYISVQNGTDKGTIACEILINGVVKESAESDTDYGIAQCSGRAEP